MMDSSEKLLTKAQELKERAEQVRERAESMTDEKLRMQMMKVADSYERMAADLTERALKQVLRR